MLFFAAIPSVDFGGRLFDHFLVNRLVDKRGINVLNELIKRFSPSKIPRSQSHVYFSFYAMHFRTWLMQVGGNSFLELKIEKTLWMTLKGCSRSTIDSLSHQDSSIVSLRCLDVHRSNLVAGLLQQRK